MLLQSRGIGQGACNKLGSWQHKVHRRSHIGMNHGTARDTQGGTSSSCESVYQSAQMQTGGGGHTRPAGVTREMQSADVLLVNVHRAQTRACQKAESNSNALGLARYIQQCLIRLTETARVKQEGEQRVARRGRDQVMDNFAQP